MSGHTIDFDDNAGKERVRIRTAGGHEIDMADAAPGKIAIATTGGQKVVLNEVPAGVKITTSANNEITVSDAPHGITLSVPAGTLTVTCLTANVTATTLLNVTAPMTVFTGVVQVPTLLAQSVVGSAYTPAPGNTFGL